MDTFRNCNYKDYHFLEGRRAFSKIEFGVLKVENKIRMSSAERWIIHQPIIKLPTDSYCNFGLFIEYAYVILRSDWSLHASAKYHIRQFSNNEVYIIDEDDRCVRCMAR